MWRYLIYSLRIRRVEYRIAELPIFLIPVFLTVTDASAFWSPPFWEGMIAFFFIFAFGDLLNCVADRDLDALDKPQLSEAVYGIGVRGVWLQAFISAAGALLLATHVGWLTGRWLLVPATIFALFVAYAYSVTPLQLKNRGLWQLAFYVLGLFAGPMIFTAMLFADWPKPDVIGVAIAYGFAQTGPLLVNTAEDFPEDRKMGVRTVIVALGLQRGIGFGRWLASIGGLGLTASFAFGYARRDLPLGRFALVLPVLILTSGIAFLMTFLAREIANQPESDQIAAVKRAGKWVPLAITSVAMASLVAAIGAWL
jgi:4-hydroxybenzoate polyprenyltransferase